MALLTWSYFMRALLCSAGLYLLYYIHWQLTIGASRRRLVKQHGCKPIKWLPVTDRILGIDFLWANRKIIREHSALETTRKRFIELGTNTVQLAVLGQRVIVTSEPDILKTVLALEFKSFCLPDGRKKIMVPFLGEGIFTTDGIAWQHSRDMLRPIFVRSQLVEDLEMFERRVNHLIEAIPKDHSTVDLQTLFFRFTLDLGTCFIKRFTSRWYSAVSVN